MENRELHIFLRDLMLHLKSLLWCLNKDRERYHLRVILDSLKAHHLPVSIQGTPLGKNLNFLIHEMDARGGLLPLLDALQNISASRQKLVFDSGEIEVGQYLKALTPLEEVPAGSYGVFCFLGETIQGLFYVVNLGLRKKDISLDQVKVIYGTAI